MKIRISSQRRAEAGSKAFTLMEVLVAVAIIGVQFVTLYVGMTQGFGIVQVSRENLRATQILQEKMETIRLYNWDQLTTPTFIPTNFVDTFYPGTQSTVGITYTGTVTISTAPLTESYSNDLRLITVNVQWLSGR